MTDVQFNLRIPEELKDKVKDAAKESGRSINAEAQYRLEQSFDESYEKQINEMYHQMYDDRLAKAIQEVTVGIFSSIINQGISAEIINKAAINYVENMANKKAP